MTHIRQVLGTNYGLSPVIIERYFVPTWWDEELSDDWILNEARNLLGAEPASFTEVGYPPTGSLVNLSRVLAQVLLQYAPIGANLVFYTPGIPEITVQDTEDNVRVTLLNEEGNNGQEVDHLLWNRMNDSHEELIERCLAV